MSDVVRAPLALGQAGGPARSSRFHFIGATIVVLLLSAFVALTGSGSRLPLDSHEVFVARSAEEMMQRGSFIVPYLNDLPRIKKPPLSYWLVIAIDRLDGGDGRITEFEARLPSIISGVIMVGLTIALGRVMFSPIVGLLAGLLLAGTGCFVNYTHSARPEMLYAMLCTGGILGFASSGRYRESYWAWLGWLMLGLAILAKGPQLPLLIVGGWMVAMILTKRGRDISAVMQPLIGLPLMLVISMWWYIALWKALPNAWAIWQGETVEKYFSAREPKTRYLDPFYLYRTGQLMLPWIVPYVLAILTPWLKEFKLNCESRLLWWILLVPMIVLSISLGRRDYYMLPITGALAALMSAATLEVGRTLWTMNRAGLWKSLAALHVMILAAAILVMRFATHDSAAPLPPPLWGVVATLGAAAAGCFILLFLKRELKPENSAATVLVAALIAAPVFFAAGAASGSIWGADRAFDRDFSMQVAMRVPSTAPLLGWQDIWEIQQYYNHRTIPSFRDAKTLSLAVDDMLKTSPNGSGQCFVLVQSRDDPRRPELTLPQHFNVETILQVQSEKGGSLQLRRVTASQ